MAMARANRTTPSWQLLAARRAVRLVVVLLALALAPAARAQLGIDLSEPKPQTKQEAKKKQPAQEACRYHPQAAKQVRHPGGGDARAPARPGQGAGRDARPRRAAPAGRGQAAPASRPEAGPGGHEAARPGAGQGRHRPRKAAAGRGQEAPREQAPTRRRRWPSTTSCATRSWPPRTTRPATSSAKALFKLGLIHSALSTFDEVLDRGPQGTRFYGSAMEWLFYGGRRAGQNEQPLLSRVARHAHEAFPPGYEDRFHFLLAKYEFERGRALADAGRGRGGARRLGRGDAGWPRWCASRPAPGTRSPATPPRPTRGDLFAKARFVDGLVKYAQGDDGGATEAFKEVVRLTNPKRGRHPDPELRELAFLQLARIHYQNRQNRYAIFYYDKMPWGGESWLEGLWEASYAYYRVGDYEKTLGNLLTLQSPYFKDEYFPESYVLKAIVYYENCRYPEARLVLETLSGIYEPVYDELTRLTGTPQPASVLLRPGRPRAPGRLRGDAEDPQAGLHRSERRAVWSSR